MEPRVVADAVEAGEEDVVMEALRTYNREVSESREHGTCTEEVGQGGARALAGPEIVCAAGGLRAVRAPREGCRVGEELLGGGGVWVHTLRGGGGAPSVRGGGSVDSGPHPRSPLSLWVSLQNSQSFTFDDAQQEDRKVGADRG